MMATAKLRSQCHSTVNCKRYAMFSFTDKFISNRHFRTTALCAVVACMLLLCLHERVAPQGSFSHPADQQWTNSEVPKFFFASASEETQTTDDVPAPENDDLETQTQADQTSQVSSSRRSSRSLGSSLRQRSVAAKRMMLAKFFLAAIPIIALGYGCYKFFEEEGETAGDEDGRMVPDAEEEEPGNQEVRYIF
uniref:Transmembrane protein n=1 Tax=Toxoplasma gondii (strain ATCC 50861 / VEG) TaxID=432359 RepID=A0A0F7VAI1_TOXGV|nr:TPA: hypothetical protein BN1205_099755 [Toxoplasma gondii VEG]